MSSHKDEEASSLDITDLGGRLLRDEKFVTGLNRLVTACVLGMLGNKQDRQVSTALSSHVRATVFSMLDLVDPDNNKFQDELFDAVNCAQHRRGLRSRP